MRIIGGEHRSRRVKTLAGRATRPTPDRLRQSLFDVLAPRLPGCVFVDAYAGSGAVGLEALSRGAAQAVFLERSRPAAALIRENLAALDLAGRAVVEQCAAVPALARWPADIVFLDPPYEKESEYRAALAAARAALVVAQHSARFDPGPALGGLRRTRLLKQGSNALSFYEL